MARMTWLDVAGQIAVGGFVVLMALGLVAVLLERFVTDPDERDEQGRR
jgi:hypothetical protein